METRMRRGATPSDATRFIQRVEDAPPERGRARAEEHRPAAGGDVDAAHALLPWTAAHGAPGAGT